MKRQRVLVTAGSTMVMIDQVRSVTNIFHGRTGNSIASFFAKRGNDVTLFTSGTSLLDPEDYHLLGLVRPFTTFEELAALMEPAVRSGNYDLVIHSAAVSDYRVVAVGVPGEAGQIVRLDAASKIGSSHERMYLEMARTPKLIDCIRRDWGFRGKLVKFKLEVGKSDAELLIIAHASRLASQADLIVANCLEWSHQYAYVIGAGFPDKKVSREEIAPTIERRLICASF